MNIFSKIALSIVPLTLLCLLGIEITYHLSKDTIQKEQKRQQQQKLNEVFPIIQNQLRKNISLDRDKYVNIALMPNDQKHKQSDAWLVCQNNQTHGIIISLRSTEGYSGNIDLLMGLDHHLTITGISVLKHQETPGLGDKIDKNKSDWLKQFNGHSIHSSSWQLQTRQEHSSQSTFDAITAATITSKAVINVIKRALENISIKMLDDAC